LSNFSGSGLFYTATFTPNSNSTTPGSVSVGSSQFSDAAGNLNADGADANNRVDFTVDTAVPVAPLAQLDGTWTVNPQATLQVNMGSGPLQGVVVEVFPNEVGATVSNWLGYVNTGFYNGVIFHRVIPGFVAQAGGFTSDLTQKTSSYDALALQSGVQGLSNVATTVAMARSSAPDSATSQFYFNLVDNTSLDYSSPSSPGYAVFGEVISGWSTIQAVGNVATSTQNGMANVPTQPVTTQSVSVTQVGQAYSSSGIIHLSGLEQGAQWSYSLDGGNAWTPFTQSDLNVGTTPGNKTVSIRQTDSAGNVSATSSLSFTQYTPDDLHSVLDLATLSDSAGGVAGTDQDNITQATSLDLSATLAAWANREVWLMDQGRYVATATANGSGALSWLNVNASAGTHVYTLYDPAEHVRVLASAGVSVSELTVRVL
jgi:peptidyl-prolyl cis-trans isomerase A (cyclophilin A)